MTARYIPHDGEVYSSQSAQTLLSPQVTLHKAPLPTDGLRQWGSGGRLSPKGRKAETLERANEFHDTLSVRLRLGRHVRIRQSQLTIKWEGTLIVHTAEASRSLERCR